MYNGIPNIPTCHIDNLVYSCYTRQPVDIFLLLIDKRKLGDSLNIFCSQKIAAGTEVSHIY